MKEMTVAEDFPAAHSMDSGWFAVDKTGVLAHFDTGEAGAMPQVDAYATGEAGDEDGERLWLQHVAPWIARNQGGQPLPELAELLALFATEEQATAALELEPDLHLPVDLNPLLVEVVWRDEDDYWSTIAGAEGFIGFAPSLYSLWEDGVTELLPIAVYECDQYTIPGDYVRRDGGELRPLEGLPDDIERMNIEFAASKTLNLADFYSNEQCVSWGMTDLRTGEPIPKEPLFSRLKKFFKG